MTLTRFGIAVWAALGLFAFYQAYASAMKRIEVLNQENATLTAAYEYTANERARLDRIYTEQKQETKRVRENLEHQLEGIRNTKADACADAPVSDGRIQWLQQPVWIDQAGAMPSGTGGADPADAVPGAPITGSLQPAD